MFYETIKLLGKKRREKLYDIGLSNDFLEITTESIDNKSKNISGIISTKKFLHSKGNNQKSEKEIYRMGKNIC